VPDQAQLCEVLLARLFTDAELRAAFAKDPERVCQEFGLDAQAAAAFRRADAVGLELAARSYARKRARPGGK
jgi:hypothetical protein